MRQHAAEIERLEIDVLVVTFEADPTAVAYVRETELPWPLLIDRKRELYKAYGMHKGRPWNLYGPSAWFVYFKLLARGRRLYGPGEDVTQLGGDVLIDPDGIVRLHHVGSGPADRPTVEKLLAVVADDSA